MMKSVIKNEGEIKSYQQNVRTQKTMKRCQLSIEQLCIDSLHNFDKFVTVLFPMDGDFVGASDTSSCPLCNHSHHQNELN